MAIDQQFVVSWNRRKQRGKLLGLAAAVGVFSGIGLLALMPSQSRLGWLGFALLLVGPIAGALSALNASCPACGKFLGKVMWFSSGCPACGKRIE
jgi:hypothetical protein